jgi:hypothetical protein
LELEIMSGIHIEGFSGVEAEVNSAREVSVAPTKTLGNAGYGAVVCEHDSGAVTGSAYQDPIDITTDYNLRVGLTTLLDNCDFNFANQDTSRQIYRNTTMTAVWGGGFLTTNATAITTLNTGVLVATYNKFPLYGASDTWFEWTGSFTTSWLATNTTIDMGAFLGATTTPFAPTDGVYFRVTSAGIQGVSCYNGSEQTTSIFKAAFGGANWAPVLGQVYEFGISINNREIEFWIGDDLMAELTVPSGTGQPMSCGSVPFAIRHAIGGTAASAAMQFKMATYCISLSDFNTNKLWSHQVCGMGQMGYQGQAGGTMGSTSNLTNSLAIPTGAAGSNTAANVTGLGGLGAIQAAVTAATDFIATSYQNPDSTVAFTGRKLVINGVKISCVNMGAAVATTATTLFWSLAFGHNAVSLANPEAATTKAPRRVPLGFVSAPVATPVGSNYSPDAIVYTFAAPIIVNPGEFIATVVKIVLGTATASQLIMYSVMFDAHFE